MSENSIMKYANGKIYKIVCNITNEVYYGSTKEPTVAKRLAVHVTDYKRWKRGLRNFVTSFPIIERGNYNIYLVELYPCGTRDELSCREGFYQQNNECVNKRVAGRTAAEYYQDNREDILERQKQYVSNDSVRLHRNELQIIRNSQNREQVNARQRIQNAKHREYRKIKRSKNREHINAVRRILYAKKKALQLLQINAEIIS